MTENFEQAWVLLGVGMIAVFAVLMLVVLIGNSLIIISNRFFQESSGLHNAGESLQENISPSKVAAIVAGIKRVTGGRGEVLDIKRKDK